MNKLWAKLRINRGNKSDNDCLSLHPIPYQNIDREYVLREDKSLTDDSKCVSKSCSHLCDTDDDNSEHKGLTTGNGSMTALDSSRRTDDTKHSAIASPKTKSDNGLKSKLLAKLRFRSEKRSHSLTTSCPVSESERDLHVVWYAGGSGSDAEELPPRVSFRHSLVENERQREMAANIAQEFKARSKSLFVANDHRMPYLYREDHNHRF